MTRSGRVAVAEEELVVRLVYGGDVVVVDLLFEGPCRAV